MEQLNSKNWFGPLVRIIFLIVFFAPSAMAQLTIDNAVITDSQSIGITTTANAKSVLDINSTTKGVLPPRMTGTQRDAISTPPEALALYNTSTHYLNFWNGSAWKQPVTSGDIVNADIASGAAIAYAKLNLGSSIVNSDISNSAAIAYGKLSLTGSVVNADVNTSAAIAYSKLNLAGSILNADVASGAAIAYSKLNLSGQIVDTDINASAAISRGKIATGTANQVLINGVFGELGSAAFLTGTLGGTNNGSLAFTAGGVLYTDGTKIVNVGAGTSGQFLQSAGSSPPTWAPGSGTSAALVPTVQAFTSGSGTYGLSYYFSVTSANATVGATYTNNGNTFTVTTTISGATTLLCTSNGAPTSSGTLTKATGTGDSTITFSTFKAPLYLKVTMAGGGGGGGGSTANGGNGGNTTFGSSFLTAGGGSFSQSSSGGNTAGGAGGTVTGNGLGIALAGGAGTASPQGSASIGPNGGNGGQNALGGGGTGVRQGVTPSGSGVANSGGGGAGNAGATGVVAPSGGAGAGGYINTIVPSPSSTYAYSIGAAGSAGTGTESGGAGGSGVIIVEEHYQ